MRNTHLLLGVFFSLTSIINVSASENQSSYTIKWLPDYEKKFSAETSFRSLNFEGASFDENYMPNFVITTPLASQAGEIKVQLSNVVTEPIKDVSLVYKKEEIGTDFKINSGVVTAKKKSFASVSILPVRKSATGGFERLLSFELNIQPILSSTRVGSPHTTTTSSILATGDWYKIGVLQTGIYKVDYNHLKSMGIDVDHINPSDIRIYGNGGGVLPYLNSQFRYDDLQLNKIVVTGENDGHFDTQDYILFYGTNQTKWNFDALLNQFVHQINQYADTTYYFLTTNSTSSDPGRIIQRSSLAGSFPVVSSYDDYLYHEADIYNFLKSGRDWYGESMDNLNNTISFTSAVPNIITTDTVYFRSNVGVRSTISGSNTINITVNGAQIASKAFGLVGSSPQDSYLLPQPINTSFFPNSASLNVRISLNSIDPNAQAWLNHYEMNFRKDLNAVSNGFQFSFRDKRSVAAGSNSEFRINNTGNNYTVWDVTDPLNPIKQETNYSGSYSSFGVPTDQLREFIAFDGQQYYTPSFAGIVPNQNLHALAQADMIIVTNPLFYAQARELAEFHRTHDNLSVIVESTSEIFNEFSSGAQDVSAIRDFVKMFYDRAITGTFPRFLCLFGDASYDNKYRISGNTNFVTSYQSLNSINQTNTYITDDFFGLLDNSEGEWINDKVDIAIGRLPVKSTTEAQAAVNKIKHYVIGNGQGSSNPTLGNWRNIVTFVADDQDHDTHFKQADTLAKRTQSSYPLYNIDKVYLDAYKQETTPGGQRYPDAHTAIIDRVEHGSLLLSYIGHGGELGWAHERVLEVNDINSWSNFDHLAAFLTATCEFTRVDDPGRTSAGEMVFLNPNGGAICMFTTSRLAFSSSNFNLCTEFFKHVFDNSSGDYLTSGEIFEETKKNYSTDPYVRNFLLIGDPAVKLAYPKFLVKTKTVNGIDITQQVDTLKALSKITITGEVQDNSGSLMTSFNGTIYPTVYDKMMTYFTLGNDFADNDISTPQPFSLQKNVVYGGKASVINGVFTFSFVVPKDISFQLGKGKLSYYAHNGQIDAAGNDTSVLIGGINSNVVQDGSGPKIQLYINDEKFVRGGMTDKNPVLYAIVKDSSGVNTVGTGIGHDMTAELDSKTEKKYVLNDYYENDLDSYQSGKVKYPFKNLASGPHTLSFKVWDVYNNSSEANTDFIVSESAELALDHVLNYPNPFTTNTTFMFEHNRPYAPLDVQVQVFTVSGKLIKTISDKITTEGYRSDQLHWDGLDDFGDRIGKGVYVYKLRVKTSDGQYADKFEKLVILR